MKRYIISAVILFAMMAQSFSVKAQECAVPMGVALVSQVNPIPASAESILLNKMRHLAAVNGIADDYDSPFYLCVKMDVVDKHIVSGAPVKHSYELAFTFFAVDNFDKKIYSSAMIEVKGVGNNETKAIIDGIRRINANHSELKKMLSEAKKEILAYYNSNYRSIITKAKAVAKMKQYDTAVSLLLSVPVCCQGYEDAMNDVLVIYQDYFNDMSKRHLAAARSAWLANPTPEGAAEAAKYLSEVHPDATCYQEAEKLQKEIKAKHDQNYKFEMKKYSDQISLEEKRIEMLKEVGVAFGKGPKESEKDKEPFKIYWIK